MTPNSNPKDDQRTTAELVAVALTETDEEIAWDAVRALHWRGGLDVLEHANQLTKSNCSRERRLGADVLGQLGIPDRTNPEQCKSILRGMLTADENARNPSHPWKRRRVCGDLSFELLDHLQSHTNP
jgi:hypothetical protein